MSRDTPLRDATLVLLFQKEALEGAERMNADWSALESGADPGPIVADALHAAHAVKGAARIVNVEAAGRLATAIEGALHAANAGGRTPSSARLGALRDATDWLMRLAEPGVDVDELSTRHAGALSAAIEAIGRPNVAPSALEPGRAGSRPSMKPPVDGALIELFRVEVEQCCALLSNGLIALEQDASAAGNWEGLLRAAHSLKGAARILGLVHFERLAHVVEDTLLLARDSPKGLSASRVDLLLESIDALHATGRAVDASGIGNETLEARCQSLAKTLETGVDREAAQPTRPRRAAKEQHRHISVVPLPSQVSEALAVRSSEAAPADVALAPKHPRVLRVAAQSIDRLMALSGESLVESRRLSTFGKVVARMRKRQSALLDSLDALAGAATDAKPDESRTRLLADAKARARECVDLFATHSLELESYTRRAEELSDRLYREALKSRMRPFSEGTHPFPRMVRDLARQLKKSVEFQIAGAGTEVDRDVLESLESPLNHLLRNALDHGIEEPHWRLEQGKPEKAKLRLLAHHRAGMLVITVSDDGRGIDAEAVREKAVRRGLVAPAVAAGLSHSEVLEFLFLPGFSTATAVTEVSGRGIGLDVVKSTVEAAGGTVRITSELGVGTSFHLELPVTRSVARALVADIGGESYAFPLQRIERVLRITSDQVRSLENRQYFVLDEASVSLVVARQLFAVDASTRESDTVSIVVIGDRSQRFGIVVDGFSGEQDLVVKPLDSRLGKVQDIAAAAILGDGSPALIVDVDDLLRSIDRAIRSGTLSNVEKTDAPAVVKKRILVVDDSITVREAEKQLLVNRGYEVDIAVDGMDALNSVRRTRYDLVVTDVDMPRMNGIDLVKALKQDASLKGIPVVIVSYKDRSEDRLKGLEAGANYYLTKSSFHDEKLVEAVEDLIGTAA